MAKERSLFAGLAQSNENSKEKVMLMGQGIALVALLFSFIIMCVTEFFFPDFFNYPYFGFTPEALVFFTPLLIYAAVMAALSTIGIVSTDTDAETFGLSIITSTLAGLWEELGFRWIFICTAMIGIVFMNFLLGSILSWVIAAILIFIGLVVIFGGSNNVTINKKKVTDKSVAVVLSLFMGILCISIGIFFGWLGTFADPLYWLYDVLFRPLTNLFTLGFFKDILYGDYPELFIFGMIAANAKFRDGHKYQGPVGWFNSWIVGFVLMYCMLTYGLWTAVVLHIVYDLEFAFIRFFAKKIYGKKGFDVEVSLK